MSLFFHLGLLDSLLTLHTSLIVNFPSFKSVGIKVVMTFLMTVINCGSQCITEKLINKYTWVTITDGKVIQ